jgi:gas vesicle protein
MSDKKSGISKENRRHLKDEIQSLLGAISSENQNDLVLDTELANETKQESPYDFEAMSSQFTKKAREITDSLFKNFVDIGIFEDNDYAKHKKELDTINISNLFFQLKTIKITIIKVMEEITSGNTHPRLIEVMGQLQDKMADITKMQANYIIFLEETYQKLNRDKPVNDDSEKVDSSPEEGQFFITVGTKNLMKSLPESEPHDKKNRVSGDLINPTKKGDLMREKNIQIQADESDEFIDLTEII